MKNIKYYITLVISIFSATVSFAQKSEIPKSFDNIYGFTVKDIEGNDFNFSDLKGKKIMIVNTASKCGYTKQYASLQKLYTEYKDTGFVIVGFPANNFLKQEPGTNEEIATFCQVNFGVTFPMMEKISVKGKDIHPIYKYLTQKDQNGIMDSKVGWNFQKYLIGEEGNLEKMIKSGIDPLDEEITNWIKE